MMKRIRDEIDAADRWLQRHKSRRPLAVVLGASINGLAIVRSLGRRGIPVLLVDRAPQLGTWTRFARVVALEGVPRENEAILELLVGIGQRLTSPGVIFPTADGQCQLLADHQDELEHYYKFLQPAPETVRAILDKPKQYEIARRAGVPIPGTFVPRRLAEAERAAAEITYPAILKPYWGADLRPATMREKGIKVFVVNSRDELMAAYAQAEELEVPVMVQEIIPGDDTDIYGYWAFWDEESNERAWLTMRKLRQSPPRFGDGSLQQTVTAPEVAKLSRTLLKAFDYRGLVGVEFKRDARDGSFKLIEINPRTEGGNQLAVTAGVDFAWIAYRHLTGTSSPVERVSFTPGITYVNEEADLKTFLALHKAGELRTTEWLRSWFSAKAYALGAWDDPMPLIVLAGRVARAATKRTLGLAG
jgi:predicted ATP-grasp superfamily ATP-dependent carboligase